MKLKILFIGLVLAFTQNAMAQDITGEKEEILTDRPDQTESANLVPAGALQIETGFMIENTDLTGFGKLSDYTYNTTLIRYGLNEYIEFRFIQEMLGQKFTPTTGASASTSGAGPTTIGAKIKVAKANKLIPEMSFLGHVTFPNGSTDFNQTYISAAFRFSMEYDLSDKFSMGINLGTERDGETPNTTGIYTLVFGVSPVDKVGVFIELYGFITERDKSIDLSSATHDHRFNGGVTYSVSQIVQLDVSAGIGLSEASAIDNFISAGVSFRLFK